MSNVPHLRVMVRFFLSFSHCLWFIGLILLPYQIASGQGTHEFVDMSPKTNSSLSVPTINRTVAVLEEQTEDEREQCELQLQRQRAEQIVDAERRAIELNRVERIEYNYQNRIARRQANEAGADVFYYPRLKEQLLKDGWCQIFDGHTDQGWKIQTEGHYGGGKFTFGQDEICSNPYHPGMVYTLMPFGDVNLRFDYWAEKDSEVLLLLKTPPNPDDLNRSCYTFVLNSAKSNRPRGLLLGAKRHGQTLAELRATRDAWDDPLNPEKGTWHSVTVNIESESLQCSVDRRYPMFYIEPEPIATGHVAFLVAKGQARFQNILWRPNRAKAIFNTEHSDDIPWRLSDGTEFSGNDQTGFRLYSGSVESKEVFGNYVLQMQYFQGNSSGRAGLFVRAVPGQENTGYEISLQNFPRRVDRESMVGVDAGGFPRIKDARYLRVEEQQWTYLTVAVVGRQIQTWVNGVPVCAITDMRKRETNTGPFLQPGVIRITVPPDNDMFQFRELLVSPITP